ncbi:GNAT family N-acetyltransferase [Pseudomonas sp. LS1212]|uniref:GNAT family N-acetyltransferase n=1 Tax=Pseudomonas sp. LS1212 TaxID=2972478 RepID=UPI00215C8EED|nr:GNAT family N-acetyltransferase [Pseudomonas sp. LS1212]UVJ45269.1 GNAT family N-acetyltransferase [Pseudomonas sp. LS1212]
MPDLHYSLLPDLSRPLLDKFYRAHRSPMRSACDAQLWVARAAEIVAALCLRPVSEGFWLTGLLVDPAWRGQGVARAMIEQVQGQCEASIWLFCHPELFDFYHRLGFVEAGDLPGSLCERLVRYQRSKPLIALQWQRAP